MNGKHRSPDFPPFYEIIDKRDIRNTFRLPRLSDNMLDKNISSDWPPKFPSHEGFDPSFPVWGGYHKTPMTVQTFADDDLDSNASSEASAGSGGSGRSKFIRGPRIHHIPILVESRDDSSGYSSDTPAEETNSVQRSKSRNAMHQDSSMSHQTSRPVNIPVQFESRAYDKPVNHNQNGSGYTQQASQFNRGQPMQSNQSNRGQPQHPQTQRSMSDKEFGSPRGHDLHPKKSSSQPPSSPTATESQQPVSGPFMTRVRVNAPVPHVEGQSAVSAPRNENKKAKKIKPNPKEQIKAILDEMGNYKKQVEAFKGTTKDKNYRYLDEMLTRLMLKLDDVDTEGLDEVRQERKNAVKAIQQCITLLEERIALNEAEARQQQPVDHDQQLGHNAEPNPEAEQQQAQQNGGNENGSPESHVANI